MEVCQQDLTNSIVSERISIAIGTTSGNKTKSTVEKISIDNNKSTNKKLTGKKLVEEKRRVERERKRRQRYKIYKDPNLYSKFLKSQKKNNSNRRKRGLRTISNFTEKQQRIQRILWKKMQRIHRQNMKDLSNPDQSELNEPELSITSKSINKQIGARKARRNKNLLKSKIQKLEEEKEQLINKMNSLKRSSDKYKKRYQRLQTTSKNSGSPSPKKKLLEL